MKPQPGDIYTHYKNPDKQYKIIGIAMHTETEEDMVIYEPQYENPNAALFARPLAMFIGNVEKDGVSKPRFIKVS